MTSVNKPVPRQPLSDRQEKILGCIRQSNLERGYAPSLREIAAAVGLASTSTVSYQLAELVKKGLVGYEPGQPRTARVLPSREAAEPPGTTGPGADPDLNDANGAGPNGAGPDAAGPDAAGELADLARVPLLGRIAAGQPITAESITGQEAEETFLLPRSIVGRDTLFMLQVVGESMVNAGIIDGDYVVVRHEEEVANGDIVAALIEGRAGPEATVKTFQLAPDRRHFWLMPHNPGFVPISDDGAQIMGKVVAVLRVV
jgi:repressor LexA